LAQIAGEIPAHFDNCSEPVAGRPKAMLKGLVNIHEDEYSKNENSGGMKAVLGANLKARAGKAPLLLDPYSEMSFFFDGWPIGFHNTHKNGDVWPVHCYAMVGVGRNLSPDTGSGAELYTVIGHAPRHLDRNIALVGRVIQGIENLSSLPRGTGALGFYESAEERVPITSVRLGSDMPAPPHFQYLSTESATFAKYADARANRRDPFFIKPAGGADICNIPVPIRKAP
jgi:peptidylprolyl isomerase